MKSFLAVLVIVLASFAVRATNQNFGLSTDVPFPGDYTGDGKADLTVIRTNSNGTYTWYILDSHTNTLSGVNWGIAGDEPIKVRGYGFSGIHGNNIAVIRRNSSTGYMEWHILYADFSTNSSFNFGASTDVPVPDDYGGDGITDFAVRSGTYWDFR